MKFLKEGQEVRESELKDNFFNYFNILLKTSFYFHERKVLFESIFHFTKKLRELAFIFRKYNSHINIH